MATVAQARQLDWGGPIRTRDGRPGILLETDGWQTATGDARRRVAVCNFNPPRNQSERESVTTYLYDEYGSCRGGASESPNDLQNGHGSFPWSLAR